MPACERCWREAGANPYRYHELLKLRLCTPEQQAGEGTLCPVCRRQTVHMHVSVCMNQECCTHLPRHGNEKHRMGEFLLFMDGDKWCAVREGFVNLQESPAGFGDTIIQAIRDLEANEYSQAAASHEDGHIA
jgi:hypothetical protein